MATDYHRTWHFTPIGGRVDAAAVTTIIVAEAGTSMGSDEVDMDKNPMLGAVAWSVRGHTAERSALQPRAKGTPFLDALPTT